MSDKKKSNLCKPPIPARPKNLIVLNSKHLPKPPETFTSENVISFIKELNLDVKDEGDSSVSKEVKNLVQSKYTTVTNSDEEEDTYGYLEPVSLNSLKAQEIIINENDQLHKTQSIQEESYKFGDILQKFMKKNSSISSELHGTNTPKPHNQWQRPLPLPPVDTRTGVTCKPWFKNVDRKKGEEILRNGVDGYFLVRPSSNLDTYLTLTLWYGNRVYNIPIRKRKDCKFALGTPKTHEQCFDSIEYMIKNYQSEKLVLYSNGVQTGKTLLTTYPP